jgi:hypothetical protein
MATFTPSPALVAYHTMNETNPIPSGNFLYQGGIFFVDGSTNVLAYYSFYTGGSVAVNYSRANVSVSNQYNFNVGTFYSMFSGTGQSIADGNAQFTLNSYNPSTGVLNATCTFGDSNGRTIINLNIGTPGNLVRRRVDPAGTGYVVFDQFPVTTPTASGTIDFVQLRDQAGLYTVNMTVGDIGSGADVEIADRTLTTAQPWQLTGSLRVRLPTSYTYSV